VPTQAEQDLQTQQASSLAEQTKILQAQYDQQQLLAPLLYKQAGYTPTFGADGKTITGFTQDPTIADPNAALQTSINTQLLNREQTALNGNLPIDPALTNELNTEDTTLNSSLQGNLGPGYATSTPGIQALALQAQKRGELTYQASTGALSTDAALAASGASAQQTQQANSLNQLLGISNSGTAFASQFGSLAQGYGQATQPFQNQTQLSLNAAQGNQASSNAAAQNKQAAIGAGVGIAAAAAIAI
jgi:hypothetical protein